MALRGADRWQCRAGAGALARAAGGHRAGVGRILAPAAADPAARPAGLAGAFTAGARSRPGAALPAGRRVLRSRSCQLACRDRADPARQRDAVRQFGQRDSDDLGPDRGAAGADGPGRHRCVCRIGGGRHTAGPQPRDLADQLRGRFVLPARGRVLRFLPAPGPARAGAAGAVDGPALGQPRSGTDTARNCAGGRRAVGAPC